MYNGNGENMRLMLQLADKQLKIIDQLVKEGKFFTRQEAIRFLVNKGLENL